MVIYPSDTDRDSVEGVCGTYNGDPSDDFMLKGTNQLDDNIRAPNDFTNSWRLVRSILVSIMKESNNCYLVML